MNSRLLETGVDEDSYGSTSRFTHSRPSKVRTKEEWKLRTLGELYASGASWSYRLEATGSRPFRRCRHSRCQPRLPHDTFIFDSDCGAALRSAAGSARQNQRASCFFGERKVTHGQNRGENVPPTS